MAIVGLLAIFGLQYVWLVNTYKLAKESIQFRSNEVFKDASMQELFHRMEELKAELKKKYAVQDTIVGVKVELDNDHDVAESGILNDNANQWHNSLAMYKPTGTRQKILPRFAHDKGRTAPQSYNTSDK